MMSTVVLCVYWPFVYLWRNFPSRKGLGKEARGSGVSEPAVRSQHCHLAVLHLRALVPPFVGRWCGVSQGNVCTRLSIPSAKMLPFTIILNDLWPLFLSVASVSVAEPALPRFLQIAS